MSHRLSRFLFLTELTLLNACKAAMNCIPAPTGTAVAHAELRRFNKKKLKGGKKMRVFKTALGVLALTLGFGLSGSVKAETIPDKDIVEIAASAGSFKTLVAAVQAAGLVDTLKGTGPFTVFAPTDEAFAKLPAGTIDNLLKPENKDQLVAALPYHVVPGNVKAADVVKLTEAPTVNGAPLKITVSGSSVKVNDA